jgi:hypothetical protein
VPSAGGQPGPGEGFAEHPDDAAALRRLRAGDATAWRAILARHQDLLYATCVRVAGGTQALALALA